MHLANGWISLAPPPPAGAGNVVIHYTYSTELDIGCHQLGPEVGNYVFHNNGIPTAVPELARAVADLRAAPNPLIQATPGCAIAVRARRRARCASST